MVNKRRCSIDVEVMEIITWFESQGIEDPLSLTEDDMEQLRDSYGIPHPVEMPNGRRLPRDEHNYIRGDVIVPVPLGQGLEAFLGRISIALTGSDLLSDIDYEVLSFNEGSQMLRIRVTGDASPILDLRQDNTISRP